MADGGDLRVNVGAGAQATALAPAVQTALSTLQLEISLLSGALVALTQIPPLLPAHAAVITPIATQLAQMAQTVGNAVKALESKQLFSD
ncbi:hypothetical protein LZC95_21110 [Pendulispora brunnea]|uniref:Uncharacterized protein n=1 Tax=Pendulispora brunnea TaxID=2905690 RepID=A0ABZ2KNS5_9BACT